MQAVRTRRRWLAVFRSRRFLALSRSSAALVCKPVCAGTLARCHGAGALRYRACGCARSAGGGCPGLGPARGGCACTARMRAGSALTGGAAGSRQGRPAPSAGGGNGSGLAGPMILALARYEEILTSARYENIGRLAVRCPSGYPAQVAGQGAAAVMTRGPAWISMFRYGVRCGRAFAWTNASRPGLRSSG